MSVATAWRSDGNKRGCRLRYKFSLQNVRKCQRMSGPRAIFDASSWVSTDNVFVFSDSGCSQRRDRVRFPSKPTGFLADLRYSCRSPRLADWRQLGWTAMPAKICRQEWRHGTSGDVRHIACRHLVCFHLCRAGRSPTRDRSHCSGRGPVCWLAGRGEWGPRLPGALAPQASINWSQSTPLYLPPRISPWGLPVVISW